MLGDNLAVLLQLIVFLVLSANKPGILKRAQMEYVPKWLRYALKIFEQGYR